MKTFILASLFAVASALGGSSAVAAEPSGIDLGLRLGYAIPLGDYSRGSSLGRTIGGQAPIWVDAGYRFTPNVMVGVAFQYGFGFVRSAANGGCPEGVECSAHDIRLGIQGQYRFSPARRVDPWIGLGLGYEWLGLKQTADGLTLTGTTTGFEFMSVQGGADFELADDVGLGPFVGLSLGEYSNVSIDCPGGAPPSLCFDRLENKALHGWLALGVRGVYSLRIPVIVNTQTGAS